MCGIYIHIPFCKQACHYCNFHFSTSLKKREEMITAICKELTIRKEELVDEVQTIYFGGGTPSLLTKEEIVIILKSVYSNFRVINNPEITLEANPDDLVPILTQSSTILESFKKAGINRLSIGVQSFFEEDLQFMNRAHNATEALSSIREAKKYFENISIDLIYGIPEMTNERWIENLETALSIDVPHLSCYALTVEPNTALHAFIEKGAVLPIDDTLARAHHDILVTTLEALGYQNYEFSNFGKQGFFSQNNMAYWSEKPYLGVGPSAHSYNGNQRSWNVSNNAIYLNKIMEDELPIQRETLTITDKYNEYVMTRLRTQKGASLTEIKEQFGNTYFDYFNKQAKEPIKNELLLSIGDLVTVTHKGKFLSDGIASDLFMIEDM